MKDDPLLTVKNRLDTARQQLDGVLRQVQQLTRKLDAAVEQLWQEVRRVPVRPHHNNLRNDTS